MLLQLMGKLQYHYIEMAMSYITIDKSLIPFTIILGVVIFQNVHGDMIFSPPL